MTKRTIIILAFMAATLTPAALLPQSAPPADGISAQVQQLEQDINANPNNAASLLRLEKLYAAMGQPDKARALLERVIKLRPDDPAAYSELGYILDIAGDHDAALKNHLIAVEKGPADPVARINLGLSYYYAGRNEEAATEFNNAIAINEKLLDNAKQLPAYTPEEISSNIADQVFYLSNISLCHLFTNRPYKALEYLETAQGYAPEDANIANLLAKTREGIEKSKSGENVTDEQLLAIRAARERIARNDPSRAVEIYRELIAAGVYTEELRINAGNAFFMLGAYDEAIIHYQKAAQINAENPVTFFNLGETYKKLDKTPEALRSLQKAVTLNPAYVAALSSLGSIEAERGEFAQAEKHLSRAVSLSPLTPEPRDRLCSLYLRSKRAGQAAAFAREWLKIIPASAGAPACLASALHLTGDDNLAKDTLQRAIAANPGDENLTSLLASISKPPKPAAVASASKTPAPSTSAKQTKPAASKKQQTAEAALASNKKPATIAAAKTKPVAKSSAVAKKSPPARPSKKPAKTVAAKPAKPAKPVMVAVKITSKSQITFKRKPDVIAAKPPVKQKPAAVQKPAAPSAQTTAPVIQNATPSIIIAALPKKAPTAKSVSSAAPSRKKERVAKKPERKKKPVSVAVAPPVKQKPPAVQKPVTASVQATVAVIENAAPVVKTGLQSIKTPAAPRVPHATHSLKKEHIAKTTARKKKPNAVAANPTVKQRPPAFQKPAAASVQTAAPAVESATPSVEIALQSMKTPPATSVAPTTPSHKKQHVARKPERKKKPVSAAVAVAPPAKQKPASVQKPAIAAAVSATAKAGNATTTVESSSTTAKTPASAVAAATPKKTAAVAVKPVRKKKPAAIVTTSPVKTKTAPAAKQRAQLAGELPILPGLSEAVKGQLASAGITPMPGSDMFDPKTLQRLRAGVGGAWIYQDGKGVIWARKSGGVKILRLADGIQPSLTADKKTLVYVARQGTTRMVKALSLTTMSSKTLIDDTKFKRGSASAFFKQPAISPDGKNLSVLVESGSGIFDLALRRLDTGTIMRPLPGYSVDYYAWDPSGGRIIFSSDPCGKDSAGNTSCVGSVNLSTGAVTWLDTSIPPAVEGGKKVYIGGMIHPVFIFSPSGKRLLIYDADSYSGSTVIADLANNQAAKITPRDLNGARVECENFTWGPDETRIAFTNESSLWVMNIDGSGAFPAQPFSGGVTPPFYWVP